MNILGRNDPCHCGSGRKYKKCCLGLNAVEQAEKRAAVQAKLAEYQDLLDGHALEEQRMRDLMQAYEGIAALVKAENFSEALRRIDSLQGRLGEVLDTLEQLGTLYEEKQHTAKAIECYRNAAELLQINHKSLDTDGQRRQRLLDRIGTLEQRRSVTLQD